MATERLVQEGDPYATQSTASRQDTTPRIWVNLPGQSFSVLVTLSEARAMGVTPPTSVARNTPLLNRIAAIKSQQTGTPETSYATFGRDLERPWRKGRITENAPSNR